MGVSKSQKHASTGNGGSRGSTNNKNRLKAFAKTGPGVGADWGGCDSALLQGVIEAITALGGACTIGLSRDGGSHNLTLMLDKNRETLWFNADADLDAELRKVIAELEAMA